MKNALDSGASKEEIMESCYVAVLMGGGPAMMQIRRVMKALEDLEKKMNIDKIYSCLAAKNTHV